MIRLLHVIASLLGDGKAMSRSPGAYARRKVRAQAHRVVARSMRKSKILRP